VSRFRDRYDEFRRHGVEVAAASVDSPYSHRAWAAELGIRYPMLSDFGREFITAYGIPARDIPRLPGVASRSAFLIDADGIIRYVWYEPEEGGLPPVEEVLEAVRHLAEPPPACAEG
jgi:glutaredoxin-dependent peroxiredoxin